MHTCYDSRHERLGTANGGHFRQGFDMNKSFYQKGTLTTLLLTLLFTINGCGAFSDKIGPDKEPITDTTPPASEDPEPPKTDNNQKNLTFCESSTFQFSDLSGNRLELPSGEESINEKIVSHFGGRSSSVFYVKSPNGGDDLLAYNEGSLLHVGNASTELKYIINDISGYTEDGLAHIYVATESGIFHFTLSYGSTGKAELTKEAHIYAGLGNITQLKLFGPNSISNQSEPAAGISVSLNTPPPGLLIYYPATLYFINSTGSAYQAQGNCLTELYKSGSVSNNSKRSMQAVKITSNYYQAAILIEDNQSTSADSTSKSTQELLDAEPTMSKETKKHLLTQIEHLGNQKNGTQQILLVDLSKHESKIHSLTSGASGVSDLVTDYSDIIVNDIEFFGEQLAVAGAAFSRAALDSGFNEAARRKILPNLLNGTASGAIRHMFSTKLLLMELQDEQLLPTTLFELGKTTDTTVLPFGSLFYNNDTLTLRTPLYYFSWLSVESKAPEFYRVSNQFGIARDVATSSNSETFACSLEGAVMRAEYSIANKSGTGVQANALPKTIGGVVSDGKDNWLIFIDQRGSVLRQSMSKNVSYTIPDLTSVETNSNPNLFLQGAPLIATSKIDSKDYLFIGSNIYSSSNNNYYMQLYIYDATNLPTNLTDAKSKKVANLTVNLGNADTDYFKGLSNAIDGPKEVADLAVNVDTVMLLLQASDKSQTRSVYRTALLKFAPQNKTIALVTPNGLSDSKISLGYSYTPAQFAKPLNGKLNGNSISSSNAFASSRELFKAYNYINTTSGTQNEIEIISNQTSALHVRSLGKTFVVATSGYFSVYEYGELNTKARLLSKLPWPKQLKSIVSANSAMVDGKLYISVTDMNDDTALVQFPVSNITSADQIAYGEVYLGFNNNDMIGARNSTLISVSMNNGLSIYSLK